MKVSIVIPVADDSRNDYLNNLLNELEKQSLTSFEVILVIGDNRQGRAINNGVRQARGEWIVTMDDDTQVFDVQLLQKLVDQMEEHSDIGMGGAACHVPDDASTFIKKAMKQIPRRYFPLQSEIVDSDFVQHPCLIMPRQLFLDIGGEDEDLIRGLDPVLRKKVRDAGKRVCILADVTIAHLLPDGFWKVFSMYRRNGQGSVFAQKFFPERVLELTDGHDEGHFVEKRPIPYRVMRRLASVVKNFMRAHWIRQAADVAYIMGWIEGYLLGPFPQSAGQVRFDQADEESRGPYTLRRLRVQRPTNTVEEQIARMHVDSRPSFTLSHEQSGSLNFYRDKVGVFSTFASEGFLVETNEDSEVLGFLFLLFDPGQFKKTLVKKGYGLRYLISLFTGRYRGSLEGWKKWVRLPLAFMSRARSAPDKGGAKIIAFVVREDLRGQGIGSKLLRRAEQAAYERGFHHLAVTVNINNEGAQRLYERQGFTRAGETLESTGQSYYYEKSVGVP